MQLEKTADTNRFSTQGQYSEPTDLESEFARFDADFEEALDWVQSCRGVDGVERESDGRPERKFGTSKLNDSLATRAIGSAVLWIEADQSLAALNAKARDWLGIDDSMLGRRFTFKLNRTASRLCELSDQMLQLGASTLQFEFEGSTIAGDCHRWAIRKTRLPGLFSTGMGCLWIARPLAPVAAGEFSSLAILEEQFSLFESLDDIDQTICQGITLGDTTSEIACAVGLTRRSVEVRRAKILEFFGFSRKVQIVRMMVRFEENGCFGT